MKEPNQEKEFERLLKEKSEGFELKPSDEVWQNVSSSLKRDRRKIIFWWSMAAMLTMVIGTSAYFILQNEKPISKQSEVTVSNPSDNKNSSTGSSQKKEVANEEGKNEGSSSALNNRSGNSKHINDISTSNSKSKEQFVAQEMPSTNYGEREVDRLSMLSLKKSPIDHSGNEEISIVHQKDISGASSISLMENVMAHHFTIEADGMWAVTYSRNSQSGDVVSPTIQTPPSDNSFWNTKGFSAGANFLFYPEKKWFIGSGIHFTKTNTQVALADQVVPQYDTTYYLPLNNMVIDTSLVTIQPSHKYLQQWIDVSLMTGVNLFPDSKNHLRLAGGVAYSRLLSVKNQTKSEKGLSNYDTAFTGSGGPTNISSQPQSVSFEKNQVQVFTEVAYVRELGSHLSVSAGGQLHYYPMNLLQDNSVKQHMMWVGLKGGVQYSF